VKWKLRVNHAPDRRTTTMEKLSTKGLSKVIQIDEVEEGTPMTI